MLKIIILTIVVSTIFTNSFGQAGFLGSLNSIEGNIYMVPSIKRTNTMELDGENVILNKRLRIAYPSYSINYSRITSRLIEVSIGLGFSRQRCYQILSNPVEFTTGSSSNHLLMEDIIVNQTGLNLELRKYIDGNIAPIGKYIGFKISGSLTNLKKNQELIYADYFKSNSNSSFFNRRSDVTNVVYADTLANQTLTGFTFSFSYGSNRIIADNLLFNYSVAVPLLSMQMTGGWKDTGVREYEGNNGYIEDYNLIPTLFNTYRKYNGIRLQIGLKYFF